MFTLQIYKTFHSEPKVLRKSFDSEWKVLCESIHSGWKVWECYQITVLEE
jgi:hypothetical protein